MIYRFYWSLLALISASTTCRAQTSFNNESSWHGYTPPGSDKPELFRPYFVPTGSASFDDAHGAILYQGDWTTESSTDSVNGTLHQTWGINAQFTLGFEGTGIEWFGTKGPDHGNADIFLDGRWIERVSNREPLHQDQQRLWQKFNLPMGPHTLRVVNAPTRSNYLMVVDAFVVIGNAAGTSSPVGSSDSNSPPDPFAPIKAPGDNTWSLEQIGDTGVSAMQLAVISPTRALIVDKVEHNPISIDGHPAWAAIYDFEENKAYPIRLSSNSFCAGGSFLSNGTMINVGGNAVVEDHTNSADFGDLDGRQAVRILQDCDEGMSPDKCFLYEDVNRIRMASPRWYNTVVRVPDGSAMIIGGSKAGGWINNATVNNPTYEFFPPKGDGHPVDLQFLKDTLRSNLFPIAFSLPDGRMFMAANQDSMIYDWQSKTEQRLPSFPYGLRVTYPMSGTGILLPLDPANNYTPEMLLCGGSTLDDQKPAYEDTAQDPASDLCVRMVLTDEGIAAGWQVENMPQTRIMPDAVLLPTGEVFIVNGGQTGIAGYGNVQNQVGQSNADNPAFTPVLYSPGEEIGLRFNSDGMPTSDIPRLYHSVSTLLPDGHILIAGSNPNLDRSTAKYQTEYRVEHVHPPYMNAQRPKILDNPGQIQFGVSYDLKVELPPNTDPSTIKVSLMDLGFVTHAVHANSRLVYLESKLSDDSQTLSIVAPPNENIYPPGPGWIFVVVNNIPSTAVRVMVGDGQSPPVDQDAIDNMLKH